MKIENYNNNNNIKSSIKCISYIVYVDRMSKTIVFDVKFYRMHCEMAFLLLVDWQRIKEIPKLYLYDGISM